MLASLLLLLLPLGVALADNQVLGTAIGGALGSSHAATVTNAPTAVAANAGPLTISVHNSGRNPVTVGYGSNAGAPPPISAPTGTIKAGGNLKFVAPSQWAGRIILNQQSTDVRGSKIEASLFGQPNIDVSYVDGFSVPIVCSCDGSVVTGCAKDLFALNSCPNQVSSRLCVNPAVNKPDGPPTTFFAPCRGAAYTYPKDDGADASCASHTISCCAGPGCPHNTKEPK